jgi:hypothetical protein
MTKITTTLSEQATLPQPESSLSPILSAATSPVLFWTDAGASETAISAPHGAVTHGVIVGVSEEIQVLPIEQYLLSYKGFLEPYSTSGAVQTGQSELNRLPGIISCIVSTKQQALSSRLQSVYLRFAHPNRLIQFTPEPTTQGQVEYASRLLGKLQGQLQQVISMAKKSGSEKFADFEESTLDACQELINTLSSYLVNSQVKNESLFLVPSEDGTILFKWIRNNKELSITIEQNVLQVQRWTPLSSYQSEGYWEITPDHVRDHFDWLIR